MGRGRCSEEAHGLGPTRCQLLLSGAGSSKFTPGSASRLRSDRGAGIAMGIAGGAAGSGGGVRSVLRGFFHMAHTRILARDID